MLRSSNMPSIFTILGRKYQYSGGQAMSAWRDNRLPTFISMERWPQGKDLWGGQAKRYKCICPISPLPP